MSTHRKKEVNGKNLYQKSNRNLKPILTYLTKIKPTKAKRINNSEPHA